MGVRTWALPFWPSPGSTAPGGSMPPGPPRRLVVAGQLVLARRGLDGLGELAVLAVLQQHLGVVVEAGDDVQLVGEEVDVDAGRLRVERIGDLLRQQLVPRRQAAAFATFVDIEGEPALRGRVQRNRLLAGARYRKR